MKLFFDKEDTATFLDAPRLMQAARNEVVSSELIGGCSIGSRDYIAAFFRGFWPFVSQLEKIVDERPLPREPLNAVAGSKNEATRRLIEISRGHEQLVKQEAATIGWLSTRKATHAEYWKEDAKRLGVKLGVETPSGIIVSEIPSGILILIDAFRRAATPGEFFGCLIAGEMIALAIGEELGFNESFNHHGRSMWIDAHLVKPPVSVLDINMSFLRAYAATEDPLPAKQSVFRVIGLFGVAASSVFNELL